MPARLTELRALARLAAPLVLGQLALMTLGVVDLVMAGTLGAVPMAALALATTFHYALVVVAQGLLMGLDPFVAQAHGAGEHRRAGLWLLRGLVVAAVVTVPVVAVLCLGSEPALRFLGQPEELIPTAVTYLRVMAPGVLFRLVYIACRQVLQARGRVRLPLAVALVANGVNAVADYAFIHGSWGLPALGVVGVGLSTSVCDAFMGLSLLGALLASGALADLGIPRLREVLDPAALRRFFAVSLPLAGQTGLESWGFVSTSLMAGWLGATVVAGHQVALNLAAVVYMIPLGISSGVVVRVGHALGRGDREGVGRAARVGLAVAAVIALCTASLFALVPGPLAEIYTRDPAVLALAVSLLPLAAAFQLFDALQVVGLGILRGLGDTRFPALASVLGFWVLGLPLGGWLALRGGLGARGIWIGLALGLLIISTVVLARIAWKLARPLARVEGGAG
ncbi:MAG: MATE family efflux transporter [Pseudomonadota bacterium]